MSVDIAFRVALNYQGSEEAFKVIDEKIMRYLHDSWPDEKRALQLHGPNPCGPSYRMCFFFFDMEAAHVIHDAFAKIINENGGQF